MKTKKQTMTTNFECDLHVDTYINKWKERFNTHGCSIGNQENAGGGGHRTVGP